MPKPLIAIVGPTATGKSKLAMEVAKQLNAEIISADSWVVRKELNIGTAKPSSSDLAMIKHHLINVIEPNQEFTAAVYKTEALTVMGEIFGRGHLPVIVGGTGLYVDSLLYDYSFLPPGSPGLRQKLNQMSLPQLQEMAISLGLPLDKIDIRNKRRIIRLIETNGAVASKKDLRGDTLVIGLKADKDKLLDLVTKRVEKMLRLGLEQEVRDLYLKYGWDCEGLKGIGYQEWRLYFEGKQTLGETQQRIIKDTMQLIKRQLTWFKRNKSIQWFSAPVKYTDVEDLITSFLSKYISY